MTAPPITSRARRHLRGLAHHLKPAVQVGGEGLSEGVVAAVDQALTQHELIKVGLGSGFEGDRKQAAADLAAATGSDLTQVIGRMVVLYRRRTEDLPDRPRIDLPDSARPPTE